MPDITWRICFSACRIWDSYAGQRAAAWSQEMSWSRWTAFLAMTFKGGEIILLTQLRIHLRPTLTVLACLYAQIISDYSENRCRTESLTLSGWHGPVSFPSLYLWLTAYEMLWVHQKNTKQQPWRCPGSLTSSNHFKSSSNLSPKLVFPHKSPLEPSSSFYCNSIHGSLNILLLLDFGLNCSFPSLISLMQQGLPPFVFVNEASVTKPHSSSIF